MRLHREAPRLPGDRLVGDRGLEEDVCGDGGRGHLRGSCGGMGRMDQEMGCGSCDKNGDCKYYGGTSVGGKRGRRMKGVDVPLRNGSDDKRVRAADRQDRPFDWLLHKR